MGDYALMLDPGGAVSADVVRRSEDGAIVNLQGSTDEARAYHDWLAAGNAPTEPAVDMPALRQAAFVAAMAYGNGITGRVTGAYADAEARSWTVQEAEARAVLAGETLPAGAMLPQLAADKGVALKDYAAGVIAKADAFRAVAVAAVRLRRGAEGLLSPDLDTPEKLAAAVEALRAEAVTAARALGLTV